MRKIKIENEEQIIKEALRRLKDRDPNDPGIPASKVKKFIARVGKLIKRDGKLEKTDVDQLAQQLKSGEL